MVNRGNVSLGLFVVGEILELSGRDIVLSHEILRKGLGALHDGSLSRGTKSGNTNLSKVGFNTVNQRLLGTRNNQIDIVLLGKLNQLREIAAANINVLNLVQSIGGTTVAYTRVR